MKSCEINYLLGKMYNNARFINRTLKIDALHKLRKVVSIATYYYFESEKCCNITAIKVVILQL